MTNIAEQIKALEALLQDVTMPTKQTVQVMKILEEMKRASNEKQS